MAPARLLDRFQPGAFDELEEAVALDVRARAVSTKLDSRFAVFTRYSKEVPVVVLADWNACSILDAIEIGSPTFMLRSPASRMS